MKSFCIAGPIDPEIHYFIPHRLDWENLQRLINHREYFVLHAPRQSGKTTAIKELCRQLNREGFYNALYINIEAAQAVREEVKEGLLTILNVLLHAIKNQLPQEANIIAYLEKKVEEGLSGIDFNAFNNALGFLAKESSKPVVLFIDEIDALIGDTLLSVLRQLRAGFDSRPKLFPHALCLIGLRDVRDYRIWSRKENHVVSTSSPFNIKSESLVLSNFTLEETKNLYEQHSQETGRVFLPEAVEFAYYLTAGQPWLVNALAYQVCYRDLKDPLLSVDKEAIERAKEALIKRRDTHIDSLLDKLREKRVMPIVEMIITGETFPANIQQEDIQYVRDLGLIKKDQLDIANPIYREIIPRELTSVTTELMTQTSAPFTKSNGDLDAESLLQDFSAFYRENSSIWLNQFDYKEAGPHLLIMAFLQRVINGGGLIQREYALGTGRVDILIKWRKQSIVIEIKIRRHAETIAKGLKQTAKYMDSSGANEGHLVVFDRDLSKGWEEKIFHFTEAVNGKIIHVWGL